MIENKNWQSEVKFSLDEYKWMYLRQVRKNGTGIPGGKLLEGNKCNVAAARKVLQQGKKSIS